MFRQLKLTCRGMFHCTFSNKWPELATLADNGARPKEHKAQSTKGAKKTPVAQGRRDLLVYQRVSILWKSCFFVFVPTNTGGCGFSHICSNVCKQERYLHFWTLARTYPRPRTHTQIHAHAYTYALLDTQRIAKAAKVGSTIPGLLWLILVTGERLTPFCCQYHFILKNWLALTLYVVIHYGRKRLGSSTKGNVLAVQQKDLCIYCIGTKWTHPTLPITWH